ncbi:MAG TPA: mechanosensitive ion channel family protein [Dehalococcoidia bacterium]|jgi:small-conductance mechanosensitive channel|nr:mechanosensitive ion channel family protein [Dehalococcoidia bacterium]
MGFVLVEPLLARFGLGDPEWLDPATAGAIALIGIVAAFVFHKLIFPLIVRFTHRTPTDLDSRLVKSVRWPTTLGFVVLGAYLAFTVPLDLTESQQSQVDTVGQALGVMIVITVVVGLLSNAIDWYLASLATSATRVVDLRLLPLIRRVGGVIIYAIGGLLLMDVLGINISPLIAGLGLGGLAVALAIQPTLANLFAGTYVMTEGVIATGDYIQLENGLKGYVVEVGWRSTRIRDWRNNLVVVPNSKFAETIITNFQQPTNAVNVYFECGTSYDSDLYRVEEICLEVMDTVVDSHPMAIKEYGKYFAFDNFGDSNVNFWLFVQATDRWGSFVVQSDMMKLLHKRFQEEGIVINYPVRTLQFPEGWTPEDLLSRNRQNQNAHASRRRRSLKAASKSGTHRRRASTRRAIHTPLESDLEGDGDDDGLEIG